MSQACHALAGAGTGSNSRAPPHALVVGTGSGGRGRAGGYCIDWFHGPSEVTGKAQYVHALAKVKYQSGSPTFKAQLHHGQAK